MYKTFKIALVGNVLVGKTSISKCFCTNKFNDFNSSTIVASFFSKIIKYKNNKIQLHIWDTAGQDRFNSLLPLYLRNLDAVIFVFDLTNINSLRNIKNYWINLVNKYVHNNCKYFLIGNKIDIMNKSDEIYIQNIVDNEINMKLFKVSAKTSEGIHDFFYSIINELDTINIYDSYIQKKNCCLIS